MKRYLYYTCSRCLWGNKKRENIFPVLRSQKVFMAGLSSQKYLMYCIAIYCPLGRTVCYRCVYFTTNWFETKVILSIIKVKGYLRYIKGYFVISSRFDFIQCFANKVDAFVLREFKLNKSDATRRRRDMKSSYSRKGFFLSCSFCRDIPISCGNGMWLKRTENP